MSERYARPSEEAIRKAGEALDRANASSAMNSSVELRIAAAPERPGDGAASHTLLQSSLVGGAGIEPATCCV
jgi:hypothetical protein